MGPGLRRDDMVVTVRLEDWKSRLLLRASSCCS